MGFAPLLDARHILGISEVVSVGWLAQPSLLTSRLAGLATIGLFAVMLPVAIAVIRQEKAAATTALTSLWSVAHHEPRPKRNKSGIKSKRPKGRRTKRKKEEEF